MNKRAITEHGVLLVIYGIIVAIAILVVLPVVDRVLFGGGGETRTAETALESLSQAVRIISADKAQVVGIRHYPLFIQPNAFIIVAFNAKDDKVKSGCYDETVRRPAACLAGKSCLCLYEDTNGKDFDDDYGGPASPIKCTLFPDNLVFIAPAGWVEEGGDIVKQWNFGVVRTGAPSIEEISKDRGPMQKYLPSAYGYENLLLYGQCDGMTWKKQDVYVEKFEDRGIAYIYIARESTYTETRFEALKRAPGAKPLIV